MSRPGCLGVALACGAVAVAWLLLALVSLLIVGAVTGRWW